MSDGTCDPCPVTHYTVHNTSFPGGLCVKIPYCSERTDETSGKCKVCENTYILDTNSQCKGCDFGYSSNGIDICYEQDEQEALNKFASMLSEVRQTECTPPVLVDCKKSTESTCSGGAGCGDFEITLGSTNVVGLKITQNSLVEIPTEIGHLTGLTSFHAQKENISQAN